MGLNTSHGCWDGKSKYFNQFRINLAKVIDIDLREYKGWELMVFDPKTLEFVEIENERKDLKTIDHDLRPLFDHSDCDGELSVDDCSHIEFGLYDVQKRLETNDFGIDDLPYFKQQIAQFREGCHLAISLNEPVKFH